MNWRTIYRALVAIRRHLTTLINWTRARAFPATGGKRSRAPAQPTVTNSTEPQS